MFDLATLLAPASQSRICVIAVVLHARYYMSNWPVNAHAM